MKPLTLPKLMCMPIHTLAIVTRLECIWAGKEEITLECAMSPEHTLLQRRLECATSPEQALLSLGLYALHMHLQHVHGQVESIGIDEESLAFLGEVGDRTSLRHG
eukprot:scaffold234067_cov17-Tisochrysis_lutea.AAC.1